MCGGGGSGGAAPIADCCRRRCCCRRRIPPNIRDIVYCTGVSLMDEDVWEFIWMKFHSSSAVSEKKVLLEALTCSDNVFLLNRCWLNFVGVLTRTDQPVGMERGVKLTRRFSLSAHTERRAKLARIFCHQSPLERT